MTLTVVCIAGGEERGNEAEYDINVIVDDVKLRRH